MEAEDIIQTKTKMSPFSKSPKYKGKIIGLDDENSIHMLLKRMCKALGFEYQSAFDGNELLNKFIDAYIQNEPFDLVIMDLSIPKGMGGKETILELKAKFPKPKVIVSTGYNPVLINFKEYGFDDVLLKPYTFEDFQNILKKYL
ncbi:response regulator [Candidatus Harpocratesius sp.]